MGGSGGETWVLGLIQITFIIVFIWEFHDMQLGLAHESYLLDKLGRVMGKGGLYLEIGFYTKKKFKLEYLKFYKIIINNNIFYNPLYFSLLLCFLFFDLKSFIHN